MVMVMIVIVMMLVKIMVILMMVPAHVIMLNLCTKKGTNGDADELACIPAGPKRNNGTIPQANEDAVDECMGNRNGNYCSCVHAEYNNLLF